MESDKLVKFKKVGLAISIIVVLNILIWTAVETFYKAPEHEDFCPRKQVETQIDNQVECVEKGGQWIEREDVEFIDERTAVKVPIMESEVQGYCNEQYTCGIEYDEYRNKYNRNVFIIRAIVGFISIAVGLSIMSVSAVASGLLYGGILSIIIGTMGYWSAMDEYLRFGIMLPTFILLIYLGYRKLKD